MIMTFIIAVYLCQKLLYCLETHYDVPSKQGPKVSLSLSSLSFSLSLPLFK